MTNLTSTTQEGENLLYDAVKDLTKDELGRRVRENAAAQGFHLTSEHLDVIHVLIEHYKRDCKEQDCFAAHEQMQFLEDAYASKGGSKYLYMLFDAGPDAEGVLTPIHDLVGLPALRLETDEGFGTAF